jgi:hypothetical protein
LVRGSEAAWHAEADDDGTGAPVHRQRWTFLPLYLSLFAITSLWALATPLYASPDEGAHAIKAAGTVRGDLIGQPAAGPNKSYRTFVVPGIFTQADPSCFAFRPRQPADCQVVRDVSGQSKSLSTASLYPPLYYVWTGLPSLLTTATNVLYFMRIMSAAVCSFFLAAGLWMVRYFAAPRALLVGVAVALTPMVLFLSGMVNPNALEIASALAVWAGAANVLRLGPRTPTWMLTLTVASACVLALSRTLSPLWLFLILAVLILALGYKPGFRLLRTRRGRVSAATVVAATLAQLAWIVHYGVLDTAEPRLAVKASDSTVLRIAAGEIAGLWRQMIGVFGWLDTVSPTLTYILWLVLVGAVVATGLLFASHRGALALTVLVILILVLPIVFEYRLARVQGWTWQGRYTLPLAVGLPIVALAAVRRRTSLAEGLGQYRLFVGVVASLANFMAFYWALRRYTVGNTETVWPWNKPKWTPPGGVIPLLVAYALGIASFYFVLCADHALAALPEDDRRRVEPITEEWDLLHRPADVDNEAAESDMTGPPPTSGYADRPSADEAALPD